MSDYQKIIAKQILKLRKNSKLTQENLAERLGVSFQAVSKWENGQSCPDIMLLPILANIFDVRIDVLFGIESENKNIKGEILPWDNDDTLHAAVFIGHRIIDESRSVEQFTFNYNGEAINVESSCSINCGTVYGNVDGKGNILCDNVFGDVTAGGSVNCDCVEGNVKAGVSVTCDNIGGSITAGGNVTCDNVAGSVSAGCNITFDKNDGKVKSK